MRRHDSGTLTGCGGTSAREGPSPTTCTLLRYAVICGTRPISGVAAHTIHRHGSTEPPHGGAGRVSPPALLFESRTHRAGGPAAAAPAASFLNAQPPVRAGPFSATSQSSLSYSVTRRQRHASAASPRPRHNKSWPKAARQRRDAHRSGRGCAHPPSVDCLHAGRACELSNVRAVRHDQRPTPIRRDKRAPTATPHIRVGV